MTSQPRHRQSRRLASRGVRAGLVALALVVAALAWTQFSGATFTSSSAASGSVRSASDWTPPTVTVTSPGAYATGTVTVSATASDAHSGLKSVTIQQRVSGGSSWSPLCTDDTTPYSCTWSTAGVADGTYDLRAVATDKAGNTATSAPAGTVVDNLAPTVTMTDPGSPLSGTVTFSAPASDAHSGVAKVVIQHGSGTGGYATLCTISAAPWSCSYDTTSLPNSVYGFRAVATDNAGNTSTSTAVTGRVVSNVTTNITLADPGTYLRGTAGLTATATSTGTIGSVRFQRAAAGDSTWTTICTDEVAPYACSFATTTVPDGVYDLRAVVTDSAGRTTISTVVRGRTVDNTAARGLDVQTTNGGSPGYMDAGDTIVFTYSERVNLTTVLAGWSGSARSVNVRVRDGILAGSTSFTDILDVSDTYLGSVNLGDSFALLLGTLNLAGTMTASTATVNGVPATVVTIRLTESGGLTAIGNGSMTWTPSSTVTDLAGNPTSTASVSESGPSDREF